MDFSLQEIHWNNIIIEGVKECRFLTPGVDRIPADVYIQNWAAGRDATLALGLAVVNPLQSALVLEAGVPIGCALTSAYDRKMPAPAD